jgi:hypothetical protein
MKRPMNGAKRYGVTADEDPRLGLILCYEAGEGAGAVLAEP